MHMPPIAAPDPVAVVGAVQQLLGAKASWGPQRKGRAVRYLKHWGLGFRKYIFLCSKGNVLKWAKDDHLKEVFLSTEAHILNLPC